MWCANGVALAADGGLFVTDCENRVAKLSPGGEVVATWGSRGTEPGQFEQPTGLAVDGAGNVYVADTGNNRVQELSATGAPLHVWGSLGSKVGQFRNPTGLALDANGNIYVADTDNNRIQVFVAH
jgi:DNA-binding beta-propeller fold protein YncE